MKILTPLKQNGHGKCNVRGVRESACVHFETREYDQYSVAVGKNGTVKDHLPSKVSRVCSLFLKKGNRVFIGE